MRRAHRSKYVPGPMAKIQGQRPDTKCNRRAVTRSVLGIVIASQQDSGILPNDIDRFFVGEDVKAAP